MKTRGERKETDPTVKLPGRRKPRNDFHDMSSAFSGFSSVIY